MSREIDNPHYDRKPSYPDRIFVSRSMPEVKWQELLRQLSPKRPLSDALGECLKIDREIRHDRD